LNPIIEKFKDMGICKVESFDLDEQPELGEKYSIKSVPTLVWVSETSEEVLHQTAGVKTLEWLVQKHKELKEAL
jgi:thiol-disulfide isomerase/thioredoxin